jgi:murein DD-endopeptidase MepM/ murein hydrolase activator NlpD
MVSQHCLMRPAVFAALVAIAACVRELPEGSDTTAHADSTVVDSATALVVDSLSLPTISQLPSGDTALRPPTSTPTLPSGPLPSANANPVIPAAPLPSSSASAVPRSDTGALVATPAEMEQLGAAMVIPVQGVGAGQLRDTYTESRGSRVHDAIDIPAPRGTPVLAAIDGKLLKLFSSKPGGLMVYASDPLDRFVMMYGHLDRYADGLTEGIQLKRGQVIGYVGTTGNAPPNTPHLHFAIGRGRPSKSWWRGTPINPYPLLTGK